MLSVNDVKASLIDELWLPLAIRGSNELFPHRTKHKQCRLFTLTARNYQEVETFEENKIIKKEDVVAWHHSYQESLRLETELGRAKVLHEGRFDDAILMGGREISNQLQCDIINLDFFSQQPLSIITGRVEKEINGGSLVVRALKDAQLNGFIFFYTTLIDNFDLNSQLLSFPFNFPLGFTNPAQEISQKIEFIKIALNSIIGNNKYNIFETQEMLINQGVGSNVFSLGYIARSN